MQRLRREIKVWLRLDHINVLPLFGTAMGFGQFPAMVCPWLENGALTSYLESRGDSLTTVQRLDLLSDVAAGLQHLHFRSVVHGDLSGSNVLIRGDGRACITDFGLSTLLSELGGSTFATSCQARGTLRWTAPELLDLFVSEDEENSPQVVPTPQSDMYSFGGIMLQVLTGKVPYYYYTREAQVVHAIARGDTPKRPQATSSGALVTDRRWAFMQRCWSSVDAGQQRPSDEEIVEFTKCEIVEAVLPQS
ncbi:kinase-like domain-containing protein [Melanogaster broomeanus]|nr:kinase-like domain-containing protein [Melanogaster broomeanus]